MQFNQIAPGVYQKWNPVMCIRTTVTIRDGFMTVKHEQPKQIIDDILDLNVRRQNDFAGYGKTDGLYQATCMPIAVHAQVMKACGHVAGQGYDLKKYKQIVNDIDYRKLKVVPGKV